MAGTAEKRDEVTHPSQVQEEVAGNSADSQADPRLSGHCPFRAGASAAERLCREWQWFLCWAC